MDSWYVEAEAARWRGIMPERWARMSVAARARVVAHWQEFMLRESEMHDVAKRRAAREEREKPKVGGRAL